MSDLISRQAAIDAINSVLVEDESCKVWFKLAVKNLPSAQEKRTDKRTEMHACDLIDRQAAIDAARKCAVKEVTPAYMLIDKAEVMTELMKLPSAQPEVAKDTNVLTNDCISRQAVIDAINSLINRFEQLLRDIRETKADDSVCGMCEYDGAYIGQSGDWCNECPGFEKDDCFKLSEACRKRWLESVALPSAQPERKRGRWNCSDDMYESAVCSVCGWDTTEPWDHIRHWFNYCPNCGADMRGEQDG